MRQHEDLTLWISAVEKAVKELGGGYVVAGFHSMVFETGLIFVWEAVPDIFFGDQKGELALEIRVVERMFYDIASMDEPYDKLAKGVHELLSKSGLSSKHCTVYFT